MKRNELITLQLQSMYSFRNTAHLLPLIKLQIDMLPEYFPTNWGFTEKCEFSFSWQSIATNVSNPMLHPFIFWRRLGKDRTNGNLLMEWNPAPGVDLGFEHAKLGMNVFSTKYQHKILLYLKSLALMGKANFGFIEAFTEKYAPIGILNRSINLDLLMPITHIMRHWLPDIPWACVFGPDYIKLFGKDRISSTPAFCVEILSEEAIFIQLTSNIDDLWTDFDGVMEARELAKRHLGYDCFFQEQLAYDWQEHPENAGKIFRVPTFTRIDD